MLKCQLFFAGLFRISLVAPPMARTAVFVSHHSLGEKGFVDQQAEMSRPFDRATALGDKIRKVETYESVPIGQPIGQG